MAVHQIKNNYMIIIIKLMSLHSFPSDPNYDKQIISDHANCEENEEDKDQILDSRATAELFSARDRLRQFATLIRERANTSLREDVLNHCEKVSGTKKQNPKFDRIEALVKTRIQKMIKNKKIKRNWGLEDISILLWVISKYADHVGIRNIEKDLSMEDWYHISQLIPGVKPESCLFKWLNLKRNRLSDHNWSDKQSLMLDKLVKKYGEDDWAIVAEKLYLLNHSTMKAYRCPKQCREHWNCYLNPNLKKGPWSLREDLILLEEIRKRKGEKKWTELVKHFDGRTENAIKNRYNLIIHKERCSLPKSRNLDELDLINYFLEKHYISELVQTANVKCENFATSIAEDHDNSKQSRRQRSKESKRVLRSRQKSSSNYYISINSPIKPVPCPEIRIFQEESVKMYSPKIEENHIIQLNDLDQTPTNSQMLRLNLDTELSYAQKPSFELESQARHQSLLDLGIRRYHESELPDFESIKVITINEEEDIKKLKEMIREKQCSFVPYKFSENVFTKIKY